MVLEHLGLSRQYRVFILRGETDNDAYRYYKKYFYQVVIIGELMLLDIYSFFFYHVKYVSLLVLEKLNWILRKGAIEKWLDCISSACELQRWPFSPLHSTVYCLVLSLVYSSWYLNGKRLVAASQFFSPELQEQSALSALHTLTWTQTSFLVFLKCCLNRGGRLCPVSSSPTLFP